MPPRTGERSPRIAQLQAGKAVRAGTPLRVRGADDRSVDRRTQHGIDHSDPYDLHLRQDDVPEVQGLHQLQPTCELPSVLRLGDGTQRRVAGRETGQQETTGGPRSSPLHLGQTEAVPDEGVTTKFGGHRLAHGVDDAAAQHQARPQFHPRRYVVQRKVGHGFPPVARDDHWRHLLKREPKHDASLLVRLLESQDLGPAEPAPAGTDQVKAGVHERGPVRRGDPVACGVGLKERQRDFIRPVRDVGPPRTPSLGAGLQTPRAGTMRQTNDIGIDTPVRQQAAGHFAPHRGRGRGQGRRIRWSLLVLQCQKPHDELGGGAAGCSRGAGTADAAIGRQVGTERPPDGRAEFGPHPARLDLRVGKGRELPPVLIGIAGRGCRERQDASVAAQANELKNSRRLPSDLGRDEQQAGHDAGRPTEPRECRRRQGHLPDQEERAPWKSGEPFGGATCRLADGLRRRRRDAPGPGPPGEWRHG